ncbi:MAG: YncE family protein [Burkholderiales bacterium]|nr:YncE family protein [Burkholderiales bacterium]
MPWLRRALNTLAWLLLCSGLPMAAWAGAAEVQTLDQGGVTVSLRFDTLSDGAAQAQIQLADSASGRALGGARPAAWLLRRHSEQVGSETACDTKAAALMSGSLSARATVDLNSYRLVTLNHDHTLAFINPHVGLQNSKLESIVQLPGQGHDWVYAPATQRLFVSLRELHAVAVVDVARRTLLHTEATGAGSLPTRLVLDEAGQRVWVGLDGAAEVLALDASTGRSMARVAVGQGLHTLVAAEGSPWLFVGNAGSDSVSLVDRATLRRVADVPVGRTPVDLAWSAAAQRLAVLSANAGELRLIDPQAAVAGQAATATTTTTTHHNHGPHRTGPRRAGAGLVRQRPPRPGAERPHRHGEPAGPGHRPRGGRAGLAGPARPAGVLARICLRARPDHGQGAGDQPGPGARGAAAGGGRAHGPRQPGRGAAGHQRGGRVCPRA